MRQKIENSEQYVLTMESGELEILDIESSESVKVEKVYYHTPFELYLFKVDGIMMHNFILSDEVASWLRSVVEVH